MNEWQPIETAPKDGRLVILGTDYPRNGHSQVKCGYWHRSSQDRWVMKDANTQVREGRTDTSHWRTFDGNFADLQEINDRDDGVFVRDFDPTHWQPLPSPPGGA